MAEANNFILKSMTLSLSVFRICGNYIYLSNIYSTVLKYSNAESEAESSDSETKVKFKVKRPYQVQVKLNYI